MKSFKICSILLATVINSVKMWWWWGACNVHERDKYVSVRKHEEKVPLGRPKHKWEDNIKMDLKELAYEGVDRTHPAQDRNELGALVNTAINLRIP
jgi:hypothetical protein